ncbi:MAG: hypothetical protein ABSC77_07775 [Terracidiphilus sp.]|jgi:hypothetical protein
MLFFRRNAILMEHPLLASLFLFTLGGFGIHFAMQYAALAQRERTTEADVTRYRSSIHTKGSQNKSINLSNFSTRYGCSYNFSVDGESYSSSGNISELSVDDSIKAELQKYTDVPLRFSATVYYDPSNPSINSLTEYGAMSVDQYRMATILICIGVIFDIFVVLGAVLTKRSKMGNRGIVVDAEGTVIYPDEINSGQQEIADNPTQIGSRDQQSDHSQNPIIRRN